MLLQTLSTSTVGQPRLRAEFKLMKTKTLLTLCLALAACGKSMAATFTSTDIPKTIPDGNTLGVSSTINVSGMNFSLSSIQVNIDVTSPWNGDLYAVLRGPTGSYAILLNQVGVSSANSFGYGDHGFNMSFVLSGANNIHYYQAGGAGTYTLNGNNQLTGSWLADGRDLTPPANPTALGNASPTRQLDQFLGTDPNGTWTLTFADVAAGGGNSILNGWSIDVTAVPEPVNLALGLFAVIGIGGKVTSWRLKAKRAAAAAA